MITQNQIWKIYGTDYKDMTKTLLGATDLAGRIGPEGGKSAGIGLHPGKRESGVPPNQPTAVRGYRHGGGRGIAGDPG